MEPGHEDREYLGADNTVLREQRASMEPGHEDREYQLAILGVDERWMPQWSPVMKTGNTGFTAACL